MSFLEHEATVSSEAFSTARPSRPDNQGTFNNQTQAEEAMGRTATPPVGSTSILEFPLNVASDDIAAGNHGHYIMFYINEQEKARLSIGNRTGGGSVAVVNAVTNNDNKQASNFFPMNVVERPQGFVKDATNALLA